MDDSESWIDWFCSQRGHEFFCVVERSYIGKQACRRSLIIGFTWSMLAADVLLPLLSLSEDAFNLYGLRSVVPYFRDVLSLVLDDTAGKHATAVLLLQQH